MRPLVHRGGHDTEYAAADSVLDSAPTLRARVLGLLRLVGELGLTDDEGGRLYEHTFAAPDVDRLTFGRRRHELVLVGLVVDSGRRRATPRGRRAIVWVAR